MCKVCLTHSDRNQREPYVSDATVKLWSHISLDNFEYRGQHFLIVLDISTKFFVVRPVSSLNTDQTIQALTAIFSEHGMPVAIRCDRGRNFVSDLFHQYCQHLGIKLSFSSAYHHSGNPAERAIHTVKMLMKCCSLAKQSWRLAPLEYLSTPLDGNMPSPSQLNGCQFGSLLPSIYFSKFSDALVSRHDAQLQCDKQGHTLPELPVGSKVGYRNHLTNNFDIGIVSDQNDRSYTIIMESGRNISRNRIDLKWTKAPFKPVVSRIATSYAPPNNPSTNAKHSDKANLTKEREKIRTHTTTYKTHSGHISKPTTRLITQM